MGWDINWHVSPGDPVLQHPLYQIFSNQTVGAVDATAVKNAINAARADNDSAAVISFLSWLLRVKQLVA